MTPGPWLAVAGAVATGILADESFLANVKDRFAVGIWVLGVSSVIAAVAGFVSWRHEASLEGRIRGLEKENGDLKAANSELKAANEQTLQDSGRAARQPRTTGQEVAGLGLALAAVGGALVFMMFRSRRSANSVADRR